MLDLDNTASVPSKIEKEIILYSTENFLEFTNGFGEEKVIISSCSRQDFLKSDDDLKKERDKIFPSLIIKPEYLMLIVDEYKGKKKKFEMISRKLELLKFESAEQRMSVARSKIYFYEPKENYFFSDSLMKNKYFQL